MNGGSPDPLDGVGVVTLRPGTQLKGGRYVVDHVLSGIGAFGMTYRATTPGSPAGGKAAGVVCIKELFPTSMVLRAGASVVPLHGQEAAWAETRQRFLNEGRILLPFSHPGIVRVHELFEENGTVYLVQEYVEGDSLGDRVEGGALPETEAVGFVRKAAEALEVVHQAGVLHRDLKPDNIMVGHDGRVVLIDFGAAREFVAGRTKTMTRIFTPGYTPLEQCTLERGRMGPPTDIYALGATLYHLLTGVAPVDAVARIQGQSLRPPRAVVPSISRTVDRAVMAAMEVNAGNRPRSASDFLRALGTGSEPRRSAKGDGRPWVLSADTTDLDAGEIARPGPLRLTIRVQNVGKGPFSGWLEVTRGQSWIKVSPQELDLRPMQSRKVVVELMPPPGRPRQAAEGEIVVSDGAAGDTASGPALGIRVRAFAPGPLLSLHGPSDPSHPGRPGIEIAFPPQRWRRRWRLSGGVRRQVVTVHNGGTETAEATVSEDPPVAWLDTRPAAFTLRPGRTRRVVLVVDARRALGGRTYETSLRLGSDAGSLVVPVRMALDGRASPQWSPAADPGRRPTITWRPSDGVHGMPAILWMLPLMGFFFWAFTQEFLRLLSPLGIGLLATQALAVFHAWWRPVAAWRAAGRSRMVWLVLLVAVPVLGVLAYVFKGRPMEHQGGR